MNTFKIVVCGSRHFQNYPLLRKAVGDTIALVRAERPNSQIVIVSGCARGADQLGERFAAENGLSVERFAANWARFGRGAGPKRNAEMAKVANLVIAFPVGASKGTKNMIKQAQKKGIECIIIPS